MERLNRRGVLAGLAGLAAGVSLGGESLAAQRGRTGPIRVVIWDEQQPAQKQAYENFLGNAIADYLKQHAGSDMVVKTVRLDDPEQGLPKEVLDNTDVLLWWGHQRHKDVKSELALDIVRRVREGQLSLVALHSAHYSKPYMEAMNARAIDDALKTLTPAERKNVEIKTIPPKGGLPPKDAPLTPSFTKTNGLDGKVVLEVKLPGCIFPVVRNQGELTHVKVLRTDHPITRGVPATFDIPHEEVYAAPFHVPTPDVVLFEERWDAGETFPSGCLWSLGKGKVVYLRPGHETYPIFKQPEILRLVENAIRYAAPGAAGKG